MKKLILEFKDFDELKAFVKKTGIKPPSTVVFNPFVVDEEGDEDEQLENRISEVLGNMDYGSIVDKAEMDFRLMFRMETNGLDFDVRTGSIRVELTYDEKTLENERLKNALEQREVVKQRIEKMEKELNDARKEFYALQEKNQGARGEGLDADEKQKLEIYADYVKSQKDGISKLKTALLTANDIVKKEMKNEIRLRAVKSGLIGDSDDWDESAPERVYMLEKIYDFRLSDEAEQDVFVDNYGDEG